MIKLILSVFIIGGCGLLGIKKANYYRDRYRLYCDLYSYLDFITIQIKFSQQKLAFLTKEYELKCNTKQFLSILKEFENSLNTQQDLKCNTPILNTSEQIEIKEILHNLGKLDVNSEIKSIKSTLSALELTKDKSYEENKKYYALYSKLGFLLGFLVVIIIY